jgi:hypothetical protein
VIFLDHLRPFSARGFVCEILFISGERALLQDASIGRQIHFVEQSLHIPNSLLEVIDRGILFLRLWRELVLEFPGHFGLRAIAVVLELDLVSLLLLLPRSSIFRPITGLPLRRITGVRHCVLCCEEKRGR